jgi:AcrR family transcriptional regulator
MGERTVMAESDVTAADWVTLGVALLQREGPASLDAASLCARLGCDLADFQSHFADKGAFALAVARQWADEAEGAARAARRGKKPSERLLAMLALTAEANPALERGVRALAADHDEVAALVCAADDRHELILTTDLAAVYGLSAEEAQEFGRVLHALHVAAMTRPAEEAKTWGAGPARAVTALLGSNFPIE